MPSKTTHKTLLQKMGLALFALALVLFTLLPALEHYRLTPESLELSNEYHRDAILAAAREQGLLNREYATSFAFMQDFEQVLLAAQRALDTRAQHGLPEGVSGEWDFRMGDWVFKDYTFMTVKRASFGAVSEQPLLFLFLTVGLGILGGLLYILPKFRDIPGIRHDHIYHSSLTRGLRLSWRGFFLGATILGILLYGVFYLDRAWFWPAASAAVALLITGLVLLGEGSIRREPQRSASPETFSGYLGIFAGLYLIGFYVLLYWAPQYITAWIIMVDPLSRALSGSAASQWFLYGLLYTLVILVMGVRMFAKYQHNRYQLLRTGSVMFFQTAFAFLIPEILVRLNQPWYDFKNIWPLNYTFFFDWNLNQLQANGALGIFMLVWGIALIVVAVPLFTYLYGKRWYCSWVCGCGGLAETMGDPYRQLSDKSLRAWKFERWIVHGVLVFAVLMTALVLYSYFSGDQDLLGLNSGDVRSWYGFLIGAAFAGVVGTGFYPLMGNRVWCRFGCPLAAYLGLVQRFRSRFRITVNGSTYCEMGIDVRWYAQRGQDVVRASCVGCGVCAAVCPRGVLRLENAAADVTRRTEQLRTVHVREAVGN